MSRNSRATLAPEDLLNELVEKVGRFAISYVTRKETFLDSNCVWKQFVRDNHTVLLVFHDTIAILEDHLSTLEEAYSISRVVHTTGILTVLSRRRAHYAQAARVAAHIKVAHMMQYVPDDYLRRKYHPYSITPA